MFTKKQLEFIRSSLTAKGTAIPTDPAGETARLFIATLDEIDRQTQTLESTPKLEAVPASPRDVA